MFHNKKQPTTPSSLESLSNLHSPRPFLHSSTSLYSTHLTFNHQPCLFLFLFFVKVRSHNMKIYICLILSSLLASPSLVSELVPNLRDKGSLLERKLSTEGIGIYHAHRSIPCTDPHQDPNYCVTQCCCEGNFVLDLFLQFPLGDWSFDICLLPTGEIHCPNEIKYHAIILVPGKEVSKLNEGESVMAKGLLVRALIANIEMLMKKKQIDSIDGQAFIDQVIVLLGKEV
eukprot:scaffold35295_cov60-Attheya_sp.AAC.4